MTFEEAIQDIKSHDFAARVNIASDFRTFLSLVENQEPFQSMVREMSSEINHRRILLEVLKISRQQVDSRYENPWDSAIAAFLEALRLKSHELALLAAEIAAQAPQCWWARKVADVVLEGRIMWSTQAPKKERVQVSGFPLEIKNVLVAEKFIGRGLGRVWVMSTDMYLYPHSDITSSDDEPRRVPWYSPDLAYQFHLDSENTTRERNSG